ncbi:MAG: hypothetical protein HYX85_00360 [Chloroflexi bacterium]|nr:hypothetical protein [Chloroflexota bacterium]
MSNKASDEGFVEVGAEQAIPDLNAYIRQGQAQTSSMIKGGQLLIQLEPVHGRCRFVLRNVEPEEGRQYCLNMLSTVLKVVGQMCSLEVLEQ